MNPLDVLRDSFRFTLGNLVATVALLLLSTTLSEADFLAWGWRVAFWFSAVVVLIGYYRFETDIMVATVAILIIMVQLIQFTGNRIAKRIDKR